MFVVIIELLEIFEITLVNCVDVGENCLNEIDICLETEVKHLLERATGLWVCTEQVGRTGSLCKHCDTLLQKMFDRSQNNRQVKMLLKKLTCNSCPDVFLVFIPILVFVYSGPFLTQANNDNT